MKIIHIANKFQLFQNLANAQRGDPENTMSRLCRKYTLGYWGDKMEHIGDLTNRMADRIEFFKGKYDIVYNKVKYGLLQADNIKNEIEYYFGEDSNFSKEEQDDIIDLANQYSQAHQNLPVLNNVQRLGQQAAVALGNRDIDSYKKNLTALQSILDKGPQVWANEAMKTSFE